MDIVTIIKKDTYFDSVTLMSLSTKANKIEGVKQVAILMGTEKNKETLKNVGLYTKEASSASPGDVMILLESNSEEECREIYKKVEELFYKKEKQELNKEARFSSIDGVMRKFSDRNLAIISVPGQYAFREAKKALNSNINVMIFSDNVSIEEELILKKSAHEKGLFVMGPDCGTAIINGKGLCFANDVRQGNIGIVAASGTGAQEVSVRIHDFGGGVSQLIGTGGRDLSEKIGGIMMLDGLYALNEDDNTKVIVLLSKPPAMSVASKIYEAVKDIKKPVVICFIGGNEEEALKSGAYFGKTTKEAALKAVILSGVDENTINKHSLNLPLIEEVKAKLNEEQKYIRGLFCGGTVCEEVFQLIHEKYEDVYSNIAKDEKSKLKDINESYHHTLIDFGDDEFTQGKPHPMIDPSLRIERFLKEAEDREVGVIILDFILGYGSHLDPVGVMLPFIRQSKIKAKEQGRHLEILAFVLGTENDPQNFNNQVQKLLDEGVTIASSSTNTGLLSRGFVEKRCKNA